MFMSAAESPTLDAINLLAQLGASDALLGHAYRELISGTPPASERPFYATGRHLSAAGIAAERSPTGAATFAPPAGPAGAPGPLPLAQASAPAPIQAPGKPARTEIVVFKDARRERSSVSFPPADWGQLLEAHGGDAERLRSAVRTTARSAPGGVNRSKWTRDELLRLQRQPQQEA